MSTIQHYHEAENKSINHFRTSHLIWTDQWDQDRQKRGSQTRPLVMLRAVPRPFSLTYKIKTNMRSKLFTLQKIMPLFLGDMNVYNGGAREDPVSVSCHLTHCLVLL
jgi:hypothetical protein